MNRLVTSGPIFVLAAIDVLAHSHKSFFKFLVADFMWFHNNRGSVFGMPVANDDIRGVLEWICDDTRRFSKLLLRAKAATVSHMSIVALAESWHNNLLDQFNLYSFPAAPGDLVAAVTPAIHREQGFKC